jgi:hypothetical protein
MTDPTLTSLHIYPDDTLRDGQRVHYGGSDRFDVSRAEYERMRAMFAAAEPVTERSCFTCRHNENEVCHHPADEMEMAIDQYGLDAGCAKNNGGMPLDRSIPCPGWSAKVTT